jgi:hypothetical protein
MIRRLDYRLMFFDLEYMLHYYDLKDYEVTQNSSYFAIEYGSTIIFNSRWFDKHSSPYRTNKSFVYCILVWFIQNWHLVEELVT